MARIDWTSFKQKNCLTISCFHVWVFVSIRWFTSSFLAWAKVIIEAFASGTPCLTLLTLPIFHIQPFYKAKLSSTKTFHTLRRRSLSRSHNHICSVNIPWEKLFRGDQGGVFIETPNLFLRIQVLRVLVLRIPRPPNPLGKSMIFFLIQGMPLPLFETIERS